MIKAIIGLGNPGLKFEKTRHNIGFRIVEELAKRVDGVWKNEGGMLVAHVAFNEQPVLLVKPQTFMNSSGQVIPELKKEGIRSEELLVVHDELEHPFGKITMRTGGSHRGHNGLRSMIEHAGADFMRLRFGIGRPDNRDDVSEYVLQPFNKGVLVDENIQKAADMIVAAVQQSGG